MAHLNLQVGRVLFGLPASQSKIQASFILNNRDALGISFVDKDETEKWVINDLCWLKKKLSGPIQQELQRLLAQARTLVNLVQDHQMML